MDYKDPLKLMFLTSMFLLFMAIGFLCGACEKAKPVTLEKAIQKWSRQYDLQDILVTSIVFVETGNGRWFSRNDWAKLHTQSWAVEAVRKYNLDPDDWRTWASIGPMQILLLTARELGYKGAAGDERLGTGLYNYSTNLKYGCMYLSDKRRFYTAITPEATWHAVAAFNAGG